MIPALKQYPRFDKGSPSTEYRQIMNFCVNYLEGMLVSLMHMDIPEDSQNHVKTIQSLQQKLLSRERTIRHAFQFQVEKYFSDFKSISRSRLRVNYTGNYQSSMMPEQKLTGIQDDIATISNKHLNSHKTQLQNIGIRLKTLVHRSDDNNDDNPISPLNLCNGFLASIETLNFSTLKNRYLIELFDHCLVSQLGNFYNQIDLGFYYLNILTELTDHALFVQPEAEKTVSENSSVISTNYSEPVQDSHSKVTSISKHIEQQQDKTAELEKILEEFKLVTENGTLDYVNLLLRLRKDITPLVNKNKHYDIDKFVHFYTSLLDNTLLSTPLKTQLSRLSCPLLELVLLDPFFFRSSTHPVNEFLQSIIDFELRFKHQSKSLSALSKFINSILKLTKPALSDYLPLIEQYESFKAAEIERITLLKDEKLLAEEKLKEELLQVINDVTALLAVDNETMLFFYDDWLLLMLHHVQKNGRESAEYMQTVEQAQMLAWFLDVNKNGPHPDYEPVSFKTLLTDVDKGLVSLNYSSEHRNRTRKQLLKEYKKANTKQSFSVMSTAQRNFISNKIKITNSNRPADNKSSTDSSSMAETLNKGDWVEIKSSSGKTFNRAKLKWVDPDKKQYIFIDQRGHIIKECDINELDQDFSYGNIKILKRPSHLKNVYS